MLWCICFHISNNRVRRRSLYSRMTMSGFIRLKPWKTGLHRFLTSTPLKVSGMCWSWLYIAYPKEKLHIPIFNWTTYTTFTICLFKSKWQTFLASVFLPLFSATQCMQRFRVSDVLTSSWYNMCYKWNYITVISSLHVKWRNHDISNALLHFLFIFVWVCLHTNLCVLF